MSKEKIELVPQRTIPIPDKLWDRLTLMSNQYKAYIEQYQKNISTLIEGFVIDKDLEDNPRININWETKELEIE